MIKRLIFSSFEVCELDSRFGSDKLDFVRRGHEPTCVLASRNEQQQHDDDEESQREAHAREANVALAHRRQHRLVQLCGQLRLDFAQCNLSPSRKV